VDQVAAAVPTATSPLANTSSAPTAEGEQPYLSPERLQHGYTIVVVGVNGDNMLSAGLAPGLVEGGYPGAVEVVDWTTKFWPLFIYHLRAEQRHETFARVIADKIVTYQARYPGRPVNLVGYSAGAVVAVESLEALPAGVAVDRTVLLAGAISPLYDLRTALHKSRDGIVSYYQAQDVVALWAGTTLAGTADGTHLPSAGAVGFWVRPGSSDEDRNLYRDKLVQLPYKPQMALSGNLGGHFQCVSRPFVARWISPRLAGHPGHDLVADAANATRQ
jgi:pimeloyl-ACP methyl ester carboxylesterase